MIGRDEKITLVIHTPERAQSLKNILESHGIKVWLDDFVSYQSSVRVAQRVKILPQDLPMALKIMESGDTISPALVEMKMAGMSGNLLIPVDFSDSSIMSVKVGFILARLMRIHPVVMHSYVAPLFTPDDHYPDGTPNPDSIEMAEEVLGIREMSGKKLSEFKKKILEQQKNGMIPDIKFSTSLLEGVPEEVILDYCKTTPPVLVVMATRGVDKKEEELIGSVTAEVLDSCRVPVFTVPETFSSSEMEIGLRNLILFCDLDQHDIITVDQLMRLFDYPKCKVCLVPASERNTSRIKEKLDALRDFFRANFPLSEFETAIPDMKRFREEIDSLISKKNIDLIIVPNKKTNAFSRIFKPTIAHKCLFERDMPMLAIPV